MADSLHDVEMEVKAEPMALNKMDQLIGFGNRKRRLSQNEISGPSKKTPIGIEFTGNKIDKFHLLNFSDEVLLEILLNCNSISLQALSKTCRRFESLVGDRRLWKSFDFTKKKCMGKEIKHLLKYVTKETKEFKIRGLVSKYPLDKWKNNTLTSTILAELTKRCPVLETIEVHEGFLNFEQIHISQFPETLKHLVFNGCQIKQPRSIKVFNKIDQHLQFLEELSLEKCNWFETHDLVVLSKLNYLKRLNLRGCPSLKEFVPYGSIACRFGFKSLESLDFRDTPVSDSDIQCFNITTTLREILLECPPNLRDKSSDKNPSESVANNDEPEAGPSKDIVENATPTAEKSTESDVETGSELDGEESEDESVADDKNGAHDENANDNDSAACSNQNHYIQVIIHDGNLVNVNNGHIPTDQMQRSRANGLRYMVGVVNGEGPADVLQRHIEERHDSHLARIALLQRAQQQIDRETPQSSSRERPETREIETQTEKTECAVNTRPNETQTEPCEKSSEIDTAAATTSKNDNKPSTSAAANRTSDIGMPGPSNRGNEAENEPKSTKESEETVKHAASSQETAGPSGHQLNAGDRNANERDVEAEPDNVAVIQPNPNVEPSNRNADANEPPRQRLIIIHQRRHGDDENPANLNRRISWEINNRPHAFSYLRQFNRQQMGYAADGAPLSHLHLISDRGLCSFGMQRNNNAAEGMVWIRAEIRPPDTLLERITVRNYRSITDVTLRHLASCAPNLQYLDVTGTSVTASGVKLFMASKPQCEIVWREN